jgi:hypothetical protein
MEAGDVAMLDARQSNLKDNVLLSSLNVRLLKSQKEAVSPANFDNAVKQSQEAIAVQKEVLQSIGRAFCGEFGAFAIEGGADEGPGRTR